MRVFSLLICILLCTELSAGFSTVVSTNFSNDALVVLDTSGSMTLFRKRIADVVPEKIREIETDRLNLGIILGKFKRDNDHDFPFKDQSSPFVGSSTRGNLDSVMDTLKSDLLDLMLDFGPPNEVFYEPIIDTFESVSTHPSFHRKNSTLNIYVITDEDQAKEDMNTVDFLSELKNHKDIKNVVFNLIYPVGSCRNNNPQDVKALELYKAVVVTNGKVFDLCDPELSLTRF